MEIEGDSLLHALATDVEHPVIVAHAGLVARLAPYRNFFDAAVKQAMKIERAQQRCTEEEPMPYGQRLEEG